MHKINAFPNDLKKAVVIPIYKKGDQLLCEIYRPISLTASLSKVFERLMKNQIVDYLHQQNDQSKTQFGFRTKTSTIDAIAYGTEEFEFN